MLVTEISISVKVILVWYIKLLVLFLCVFIFLKFLLWLIKITCTGEFLLHTNKGIKKRFSRLPRLLCCVRPTPPPSQSLVQWDVWCWQAEHGCRLYRPYVTMCWPQSHFKRKKTHTFNITVKQSTGLLCSQTSEVCSANGRTTTAAEWCVLLITLMLVYLACEGWWNSSALPKL